MKGLIITYQTNSNKEIVDLNNYLFGRVVKVKRSNLYHYYYYPGLLHNAEYYKLSNGCYFISNTIIDISHPNMKYYHAHVSIKSQQLITAEQHFKNKYAEQRVNNLG